MQNKEIKKKQRGMRPKRTAKLSEQKKVDEKNI
jgi:hypothetical protein